MVQAQAGTQKAFSILSLDMEVFLKNQGGQRLLFMHSGIEGVRWSVQSPQTRKTRACKRRGLSHTCGLKLHAQMASCHMHGFCQGFHAAPARTSWGRQGFFHLPFASTFAEGVKGKGIRYVAMAAADGESGGAEEEDSSMSESTGEGFEIFQGGEGEALQSPSIDTGIPETADQLLQQVASDTYEMGRRLEQLLESGSYEVLDKNPWETTKPVYVLATQDEELFTMRTRRARSEVGNELDMLFSGGTKEKAGGRRGTVLEEVSEGGGDGRFEMHVDVIQEGVLVFEDEHAAVEYCTRIDGGCSGVVEVEANDVFTLCQRSQALAVVFRSGQTPPDPVRLQQNLKAKKHSLED